jgi:hypothetical protein
MSGIRSGPGAAGPGRGWVRGLASAVLAGVLALAVLAPPAGAQGQGFEFGFPAGIACEFELHVSGTGGNINTHEFTDRDGNVLAVQFTGKGPTVTLTNVETGKSITLRPAGGATRITLHDDGTSTVELIGHQLLFMFPSDVPAGPSSTLYVGRVVIHVDADEVFTILKISGRATDMCAALSG